MADRRRRRRRASQDSDDDDDESASGSESPKSGSQTSKSRGAREPEPPETAFDRTEAKEEVQSECESEDGVGEAVLSDYDSADPEENASRSEGAEEEDDADGYSDDETPAAAAGRSEHPANAQQVQEDDEDGDEPRKEGKESEVKAKSAGERQSGDGQESTVDPESKTGGQSGQRLDDDEDRKNPAYIPRKGLFFEHDVRGHAQEDERPKGRNRKLWKDEGRWEHDKFREEEQAPKSREEIISVYGYDIRNGERGQRRPRPGVSPNREQQRWREGAERTPRSWQSSRGGRGGGTPRGGPPHHASPASIPQSYGQRGGGASRSRGPRLPARHVPESHVHQLHPRERALPKGSPEPAADEGRAIEDPPPGKIGDEERAQSSSGPSLEQATSPEQRGGASSTRVQHASASPREASPPAERPIERKSYSLARRSRSRPSEPGGKRTVSVEEAAAPEDSGMGGGAEELDRDVARLSLVSGRTWNQSPASYVHPEMRGLSGGLHVASAPPPSFSGLDEMSSGANRAKRYSSQRQRGVAEAAPPLHVGVMEGHFYEPMTYPGPIYTHSDASAPIAPQGMLVQPEMHIPHPGLHAHQSGGPIANPALYGGPPVSLSPGQPQQLLPSPFYPPPGVMTFPYPTMYPSPQGQSQVTYGGVTYYDTVQQQAQPKPSPPRRTSQPVTVKPPPPEVPFASE
ncbi:protein CASC3 [Corythoichthys intestinalis]|uniref:protein CASC3 n=1 Tax=Corythoichthys intestinalis TaxID=161448 RepID=UPI0025A61A01|nr:protein CASC3 [Corythoichthys intestinalis]XP_061805888.1 protein CASC3-like [Nerophis lumbriciformis]